jgi:hypothetical protein
MSGTTKLLLGLGIGCGVVLLVCCGGVGAIMFFGFRSVKLSESRPDIVALTKTMTDIAIPEGLEPVRSFSMEMPVLGHFIPAFVVYEDKPSASTLVLVQSEGFRSQPPADIRQMMEQMLRQQGVDLPSRELTDEKLGTHEATIRGVRVTFTIVEGTDVKTKAARIRATGIFPGKTTTTALLLDTDAAKLGKPAVVKMIDSIH